MMRKHTKGSFGASAHPSEKQDSQKDLQKAMPLEIQVNLYHHLKKKPVAEKVPLNLHNTPFVGNEYYKNVK